MKNLLRVLGIFSLIFIAAACSKDDDPADNDLFVGTYDGSVSYTDGDDEISSDDSSVTVVKAGNNYNFKFNKSGIPTLKGVEFEEDGDHGVINVDFEDGVQFITINQSKLRILYSKDGETWTANAER